MTDLDRPELDNAAQTIAGPPTRRTVLRVAGLTALVGTGAAAAACSPETPAASSAPTTSDPSPAAPSPAESSSESPSADPSAAESSAAEPAPSPAPSGPSVATAEVPEGGGVILDDADYVVTQPTAGEYKAFSSICTHQACKVASVDAEGINCACHGSKFSLEDGSVLNPPATQALAEATVTVSGANVVISV